MTRFRTLALRILPVALAALAGGSTFVACGGGGGGGGSGVFSLFSGSAARADLSGQSSAYTGDLDAGTTITFPAVKGATYLFQVQTSKSKEDVVLDVYSESGAHIRSKTVTTPGGWSYTHDQKTQHVLVFVRPWNPLDLGIKINSLTVTGMGTFPQDRFHVNFFAVGKFTGYGFNNDLAQTADQAAFTDAVMAKVRQLFVQSNINISYEGFHYTADQVRARDATLIAPDDQSVCSAGESLSGTGFQQVATDGLNRYGNLGFPASDTNFNRAHGIDVFFVHHFTNAGTVGLSPRPGQMTGNGADTALVVSAFLLHQGRLIPRTPDQVATVLAHELGHFLGLQHTTTFDPSPSSPTRAIDDGLPDTPACSVLTDVNGDGIVGIGDGCQDEGNIMFYQAGAQTIFSARQNAVMRALLSIQEH